MEHCFIKQFISFLELIIMDNRSFGVLMIIVAALIGYITFSFNAALSEIVKASCSHGSTCPMWGSIEFQTHMSIAIMTFVFLIGIYLIFFGNRMHKQKRKRITKDDYRDVLKKLNDDEKSVLESIIEAEGSIFQSELVEKTGFNKVKVTRVLDRLEGMGLIERKRRGMTNMVILKHP